MVTASSGSRSLTPRESAGTLPPGYWDTVSNDWDRDISKSRTPHAFYYAEADLCIDAILKSVKPCRRVLELGCGTGGSTRVHAGAGRQLIATDLSVEMVRRARPRVGRSGISSYVEFAVVDAVHLPFRAGVFDAVVSRGVVLSYVRDPPVMLREARRVLRRGGKVGLDVMNRAEPVWWPERNPPRIFRSFHPIGRRPAYVEMFSRRGVQVRTTHYLKPSSRLGRSARKPRQMKHRPRDLLKQTARVRRYYARSLAAGELDSLARRALLRGPRIYSLGQLFHSTLLENGRLRRFTWRNRKRLSELFVALNQDLRPATALHRFLEARR